MKSYTRPLLVTRLGADGETATALEALPLRAGEQGVLYDERWLQNLIQRNPHIVPVDQIEPALTPLVPICMELPTGSGWADNLLMTADGGIILVEAKLWRNPEARREVIGQVLDYAKDLAAWTYAELQHAVRVARKDSRLNLYDLVCGPEAPPELEAAFADAVSRNLRLGRVLLIIAGDGIQESAERLAEFLQRHLGLHFTLAMVEISLWRTPLDGAVFIQPKVLTRTVQIERAVVRLEGGDQRLADRAGFHAVAANDAVDGDLLRGARSDRTRRLRTAQRFPRTDRSDRHLFRGPAWLKPQMA